MTTAVLFLALATLARAGEESDPWLQMRTLLLASLKCWERPGERAGVLSQARALAARFQGHRAHGGLVELVKRWESFDRPAVEREVDRARRHERALGALKARRLREVLALADPPGLETDASPTAPELQLFVADALKKSGRQTDALQAYRRTTVLAERLGWRRLQAYALDQLRQIHHVRGDVEKSVAAAEETLRVFECLDDRAEIAKVKVGVGFTWRRAGRLKEAWELQCQARAELLAMGNRRVAATALESMGNIELDQGFPHRAAATLRRAVSELEDLKELELAAHARANLGQSLYQCNRFTEARWELERALVGQTNPMDVLVTLRHLGQVLEVCGEPKSGPALIQDAITGLEAIGAQGQLAMSLLALGGLYELRDENGAALDAYERALAIADGLGDEVAANGARQRLGIIYHHMADYENAERYQEQARAGWELLGWGNAERQTALFLARSRLRAGKGESARRTLDRYLAEPSRASSIESLNIAGLLAELGDSPASLEWYRRALELAEGPTMRATIQIGLARPLMALKRYEEARRHLEQALPVLDSPGNRGRAADAHGRLADAWLELKVPARALEHARQAATNLLRRGEGLGEHEVQGIHGNKRWAADLGLRAAAECLRAGAPTIADAFWFAEAGRALGTARLVVQRRALWNARLPDELRRADATTRAGVVLQEKRLADLRGQPVLDREALDEVRNDLDRAWLQREEFIGRLQRQAQRTAGVVYPEPTTLGACQAELPEGTAYVAYQVDQGRFFALVVTRSAARLVELTGPERLSSLTGFARAARMIGSDPSDSAAAAYDLLLRPLEDALAGQTRLLISPDRFLSFIPFEALLRREGDRSAWALERWEIAYVPSATVYAALREDARDRPAGSGLVALGDPAYGEVPAEGVVARRIDGIERLEQSGAEVREIGRLFPEPERTLLLGRDATLTGLRAALEGRARPLAALHLACHGEIDEGRPLRSALLLAGGERLGLDEVYALRAPSDLAVLSACDSGRGPLRDGEGVIGLVRGFFFAGCPRVVVANWPVQDESTRRLMTAFYARWRGDRLAPAAALRAAKRDLLAASRETAHPYHWAGFVLWGLPE